MFDEKWGHYNFDDINDIVAFTPLEGLKKLELLLNNTDEQGYPGTTRAAVLKIARAFQKWGDYWEEKANV